MNHNCKCKRRLWYLPPKLRTIFCVWCLHCRPLYTEIPTHQARPWRLASTGCRGCHSVLPERTADTHLPTGPQISRLFLTVSAPGNVALNRIEEDNSCWFSFITVISNEFAGFCFLPISQIFSLFLLGVEHFPVLLQAHFVYSEVVF